MNFSRSASIQLRHRAASNVLEGEGRGRRERRKRSECHHSKDDLGLFPRHPIGEKSPLSLLPASSAEYAPASHLAAVQRSNKAHAHSVRHILSADVNLSVRQSILLLLFFFSLLSSPLFFSLNSWRRPRIKFWQRARDRDLGDALSGRQASTFEKVGEPDEANVFGSRRFDVGHRRPQSEKKERPPRSFDPPFRSRQSRRTNR